METGKAFRTGNSTVDLPLRSRFSGDLRVSFGFVGELTFKFSSIAFAERSEIFLYI